MGRQAYLTRLALVHRSPLYQKSADQISKGRSAFQAPDKTSTTEIKEESRTVEIDTTNKESSPYVQQYDNKGYAINPSSTELRRRLTRAQNDVLATVGVCAKVNDNRDSQPRETLHRHKISSIESENDIGLNVSLVGGIAAIIVEPWAACIRQRFQTFRSFSGIPLFTAIRSDRRAQGPLSLFYAGAPSSWVFSALDLARHEIYILAHDYGTFDISNAFEKSVLSKKDPSKIVSIALKFLKGFFFVLLTPFEVFATLQRLGISSAWPIVPGPRAYKVILRDLIRLPFNFRLVSFASGLRALRSMVLMPLCTLAVITYTKPLVTKGFYRYFRAALPKPTHPDRYSLEGAVGEFDSDTIPALIDEDSVPKAHREITKVVDLLRKDLRTIGYKWQLFWSRFFGTLTRMRSRVLNISNTKCVPQVKVSRSPWSPTNTINTVRNLPDNIVEVIEEPDDTSAQGANMLGLRPELQDLLDPMPGSAINQDLPQRPVTRSSSPLTVPLEQELPEGLPVEAPQSPAEQLDNSLSPIHGSVSSSATQSRVPTPPPPIEIITSTAGTGHMHMNVTIPVNIWEDGYNQGFRAPSTSSSDSSSDDDPESDNEERPYHRVTMMSAYAAETMADHLSGLFASLLLLPLETLFVRNVATTFWQAPGLVTGGRGTAERWRENVYPLGSWFGAGLRAGGCRGAWDYAGKMLLVWGLQVGVNFTLWQMTTVYIWHAGHRWYNWGRL